MFHPPSDVIYCHIQELTARIVAETGIPSDRYHLGKLILRSLRDAPDHMLQIDGTTGEKDTFKSGLEKSILCATAFRKLGLNCQDLIIIMAPNHVDLVIPMYASLYLGVTVAGIDRTLGVDELKHTFTFCVPKVIFCQSSKVQTIQQALDLLNVSTQIITFDEKENYLSFSKFLDNYGEETMVDDFKPADFDPVKANAFLLMTSGSMGLPKTAALSHKNILIGFSPVLNFCTKFPTPVDLAITLAPVQWLSSTFVFIMGPILRFTRLQTSSVPTPDHVYTLINEYKPDFMITSPTFLTTLTKPDNRHKCDFTSLRYIVVGGSTVSKEIVEEVKKINPTVLIKIAYGMTEATGTIFEPGYAPFGSVGAPVPYLQYKLVDPNTNEDINQPNTLGELRIKGSTVFQGYYNNPEMTAAAFDEDGWLKTGDILYRDEHHNYYFYDRIKMLLKYKSHQVSPVEIESVILKHPGVLDVAVTGVPDAESGDLPVAYVILRDGHSVTAQQIKDLVKGSLTDSKQLRGGVVFVDEFPTTSTSKLDRAKLKELAKTLKTE